MEYSQEQYKEDLKLVCYTYYKYFKYLKDYKEDLVQNGLLFVLSYKDKYDKDKTCYSSFVCAYARFGMLKYLKDLRKFNNNSSFVSIDAEIVGTDELHLIDTLQDENALNNLGAGLDLDFLNKCIDKAINKVCVRKYIDFKKMHSSVSQNLRNISKRKNKFNEKRKEILLECLKNKNKAEIAREFGISREAVRNYFERFRQALKIELENAGYFV